MTFYYIQRLQQPGVKQELGCDMNILHIISGGDTGGAKTHVITLLKQINKVKTHENKLTVTLLCLMEGSFAQEARDAGIAVKVIEQKKRYHLSVVWSIARYVRENGFDVLHFHGARANFVAMFLRRMLAGRVFCTTVHSDYKLDFVDSRYKQSLYMPLNKFALKRFRRILAVTESMKDMLISRGFNESRIDVVYNGIDVELTRPTISKPEFLKQNKLSCAVGMVYIGIAARMQHVKGIDIFLRAAKIAAERMPNVMFLIAGSGDELEMHKQYAEENGLSKRVTFMGHVKDVFSFYKALDVNCLASRSETFPYALLEGGLMAKATVSAACGGVPEMIEDGRTGLLVPVEDAEAMADAMCRLAESEGLRRTLGMQFFSDVQEKFSAEKMGERHLELYRQFMARSRRERRPKGKNKGAARGRGKETANENEKNND